MARLLVQLKNLYAWRGNPLSELVSFSQADNIVSIAIGWSSIDQVDQTVLQTACFQRIDDVAPLKAQTLE